MLSLLLKMKIEFKWIFYAAVDEDYDPPKTGLFAGDRSFWLICIAVLSVLILGMLILVLLKRRRKPKKS